jgi:hypothetical protein
VAEPLQNSKGDVFLSISGGLSPGTEDAVKKNQETTQRRLTLNRETIRRLENQELLGQVVGGTSQWLCPTTTTREEYNAISGDC